MTHTIHHSTDHYVCLDCGIRLRTALESLQHIESNEELEDAVQS